MLHTFSFDEVSSPDVNLQADAIAADPMVDGTMFRGSDAKKRGLQAKSLARELTVPKRT